MDVGARGKSKVSQGHQADLLRHGLSNPNKCLAPARPNDSKTKWLIHLLDTFGPQYSGKRGAIGKRVPNWWECAGCNWKSFCLRLFIPPRSHKHLLQGIRGGFELAVEIYDGGIGKAGETIVAHPEQKPTTRREAGFGATGGNQ